MSLKALLTPSKAAEVLDVNTKTLANWRSLGIGPAYIKVGRLVKYTEEAINEWLTSNTVNPA